MDRINGAGHVGHLFVAEDAAISRPPTEVTAEWLNGVQEEIIEVIEASGQAPNGGIFTQLLSALSLAGVFTTAPVSENSTRVATTAWIRSAMSNIFTAAGFVASLATNGFVKFPSFLGGWIIQWGHNQASVAGSVVTFPIAFPVECFQVLFGQSGNLGVTYRQGALNPNAFTFFNTSTTGSHSWLAVGR